MRFAAGPSSIPVTLEDDQTVTRFPSNERCGASWLLQATEPWLTLAPHPNVATLFSTEQVGQTALLRSEAVLGRSLEERRQSGLLAPEEFKRLVCELAAALSHAHSHGVVHGSLHPEAIGFEFGCDLKLFRWSPEHLASWGKDWSVGPPPPVMQYQAPEQLRAEMNLPASDVYGVGALLYRVSAGRPPFRGEDLADLCFEILTADAPLLESPEGYPENLPLVLADCLAKSVDARPSSIVALLYALYPQTCVLELPSSFPTVYRGGDNRPQPDPEPIAKPAPVSRQRPKPRRPKSEPLTVADRNLISLGRSATVCTLRAVSGCTVEWLRKSAGRWAKLRHPNIASIYRIEEWHGLIRVCSEPVEGADLNELLAGLGEPKYPLPEANFRRVVHGLLRALAHAHQRLVVHGALSADCLVVKRDGTLSVLRYSAEHLKAIAGPGKDRNSLSVLSYQAPEQFDGITTAASDIYAVGMLLYHLALGRLPFQLTSPRWMADHVSRRSISFLDVPKGYPSELAATITDCLATDPRRRPASAAEVLRRLYPEETLPKESEARWKFRQDAVGQLEEGRLEAAREAWETICSLESCDPWSQNNLGVVLSRQGLVKDALERFRLAAAQLPENATVACNLAWALHESGHSRKEALECFDRAIELDPGSAQGLHLRGLCRGGHRAIADFLDALWRDPGKTETYLALADELEACEQFDAAQQRREQAAQCARPPVEAWPEVILEEKPCGWTSGENWPPSPAPFEDQDEEFGGDDDGGAPVPLRRPPYAPSGSEAKALPLPCESYRHEPRFLRRAKQPCSSPPR